MNAETRRYWKRLYWVHWWREWKRKNKGYSHSQTPRNNRTEEARQTIKIKNVTVKKKREEKVVKDAATRANVRKKEGKYNMKWRRHTQYTKY